MGVVIQETIHKGLKNNPRHRLRMLSLAFCNDQEVQVIGESSEKVILSEMKQYTLVFHCLVNDYLSFFSVSGPLLHQT